MPKGHQMMSKQDGSDFIRRKLRTSTSSHFIDVIINIAIACVVIVTIPNVIDGILCIQLHVDLCDDQQLKLKQ